MFKIAYRFCCLFFKDWNITFSFLKTWCKLLLSTNFLRWMQNSCLYHVFIIYSCFYRNVFLLTILKGLKPFWLQIKTWNWIKELLALEFCRNQKKVFSILTETHINNDQTHHIRKNWLGSKFFSLGDAFLTQNDACPASSGTWRWTLIQKGFFCPLSLLPLMTEFCVYAPSV